MLQPKIAEVRPLQNYRLFLRYENGERRVFDVKPYISGAWFGELRDISVFNTVRVSGSSVEWAGGQDIAPHELYELPVPE